MHKGTQVIRQQSIIGALDEPSNSGLRSPSAIKAIKRAPFSKGDSGRFEGGFTLMELLWMLFILSILMSVVVPNFSGSLFQIGLEKKAREIFAALAYAQQQALNQNDTFGISFDMTEGNQKITCYRRKGYDNEVPIVDPNNVLTNPLTHKPYVIEVNHEGLSSDACITEADFGGKHWVEFNPLGDPNHEGQVILAGANSSYTIMVSRIGRLSFSSH